MSSDDVLSSLGIVSGVASSPPVSVCSNEAPLGITYPTGTVATLAITGVIPWLLIVWTLFKFRAIFFRYVRDHIEYLLSDRTDLSYRLSYEFVVGSAIQSAVILDSNGRSTTLALEGSPTYGDEIEADNELSEVIVQ